MKLFNESVIERETVSPEELRERRIGKMMQAKRIVPKDEESRQALTSIMYKIQTNRKMNASAMSPEEEIFSRCAYDLLTAVLYEGGANPAELAENMQFNRLYKDQVRDALKEIADLVVAAE